MTTDSFRDDVIIAAVAGDPPVKKIYKISQEALEGFAVPYEHDDTYNEVVKLLEAGVQVAAIPISAEDGGAHARGDVLCYLLNLSGLQTKTAWED